MMQAAGNGLQMRGLLRQDQKAQRMQAFEQAFTQASQGMDLTSEDNLRATLQKTVQQFPEESLEVFKKYKEVFPQATPEKDAYDNLAGAETPTLYNKRTGEVKETGVAGKQKSEPEQWDKVDADDGTVKYVNRATGLGRDGKPVKFYKPPRSEGGLTAASTVGILERLGRRMDDDPALKILERRDNFHKTAQTAYDQYLQAPEADKNEARRQADQQLLFSLAKMRDEGVVMPGEFVRETQGQGWLKDAINAFNSGVEGGLKLSDPQRKYILDLMGKFREQAKVRAKPRYDFYRKQGAKYQDAEMVTGAWDPFFAEAPAAPSAAPAAKPPQSLTKPEEEDEYQAWKKAQGIK
jgi:hypothetical protein